MEQKINLQKNYLVTPCTICDTKYQQSKTVVGPERYGGYTEYFSCPKCGYNPYFEIQISEIIRTHISTTRKGSKLKVNSRELADIVNKEIKEIWPKHEK